jgi:hypothetical protein
MTDRHHTFVWSMFTVLVMAFAASFVSANEIVEMRLSGHYYSGPATVLITVSVEPDSRNRMLRLEADGDNLFRSTEQALSGASEQRVHTIEFKSLPSGHYTLRAQVLSGEEKVRGEAVQELVVE